jgi:hypothetical protein
MTASEASRLDSAARRAKAMIIRKGQLGRPEVDFSPVSGAAAISLLTQLTRESFSLAGGYPPENAGRMIMRFEPRRR